MASLKRIAALLWLLFFGLALARSRNADGDADGDADADVGIDADDVDTGTNAEVDEGDEITMLTGTRTDLTRTGMPTGSYQSVSSTVTLETTATPADLGSPTGNATDEDAATPLDTNTVTYITGSATSSASVNTTASSTSAAPRPTNTRPCNNYPELCARKYSNITQVGCHNSPFVRAGSAAANQELPVTDQLNDGVRFLQAQVQWPTNGTVPHFCHTSCDLLDAGPITDWLRTVKDWVAEHPYDVVTILLGNGNYSTPDLYVPHIEASGILKYVFTPPVVPMGLDDWPTLGEMILSGQRVVMLLDYVANQTAYPWLLDQFAHMWETPFDPTDTTFPCVVQRPPGLGPDDARRRLYLMNHNLNVEVSLLGQAILVPAVSELNVTNAAEGPGSLGMAANNCRADWGRPPNVLNVDYYNYGNYPGSVFEVAARMNNVTFRNQTCCGTDSSSAVRVEGLQPFVWTVLAWVMFWMLV